jgi:hypothetical protein
LDDAWPGRARERFAALLAPVIDVVRDCALDEALQARLSAHLPPTAAAFLAIERACHDAIGAGWMCAEGGGQRRFGRVLEPCAALARFSVDVVDITELVGNHHRHPTGEIDMIMPVTPGARFDECGPGWRVYPPGSAHRPTVAGGRALVLYLLPEGRIEWTQDA